MGVVWSHQPRIQHAFMSMCILGSKRVADSLRRVQLLDGVPYKTSAADDLSNLGDVVSYEYDKASERQAPRGKTGGHMHSP